MFDPTTKDTLDTHEGKIIPVRSGIRTHALKWGLRPERSALDRSAILTLYFLMQIPKLYNRYPIRLLLSIHTIIDNVSYKKSSC